MSKQIFVVTLHGGSRRSPIIDKFIIRAKNGDDAVSAAKSITIRIRGACVSYVREADPVLDLGCKTKQEVQQEYALMRGLPIHFNVR